jgi:hypothetical protein
MKRRGVKDPMIFCRRWFLLYYSGDYSKKVFSFILKQDCVLPGMLILVPQNNLQPGGAFKYFNDGFPFSVR